MKMAVMIAVVFVVAGAIVWFGFARPATVETCGQAYDHVKFLAGKEKGGLVAKFGDWLLDVSGEKEVIIKSCTMEMRAKDIRCVVGSKTVADAKLCSGMETVFPKL